MAIAHRTDRLQIGLAAVFGALLISAIAAADPVPVQVTFKIPGDALRLEDPYWEVSTIATAQRTGVSPSVLSFEDPIFDEYLELADSDFTDAANLPPHSSVGLEIKGGAGVFQMGATTMFVCPLGGLVRACVSGDKIGGAMPIHARIRLATRTPLGGMASFFPSSLSHRLGTARLSSFRATNPTPPPYSTVLVRFTRPPWTNGSAKALSVGPGGQKMITKAGGLTGSIMTNGFQLNLVVPTAIASFRTTNGQTSEVTNVVTAELRIVPEPASGLLLGAGAAVLAALGHRHKRGSRISS